MLEISIVLAPGLIAAETKLQQFEEKKTNLFAASVSHTAHVRIRYWKRTRRYSVFPV